MTKLSLLLMTVCLALGFWDCWGSCYKPNNDAIHYLNIGEALLRHDAGEFINYTWGPLYGVVATAWLHIFAVPRVLEREALKVLNLVTLGLVLWCFNGIVRRVIQEHAGGKSRLLEITTYVYCYGVFVVAESFLGVFRETPDLMLLLVVLLSVLACLRLTDHKGLSIGTLALVGVCGAAGFYLKQAYAPVAALFVLATALAQSTMRARLLSIGIAGAALGLTVAPWAAALSLRSGKFTLGGNVKLNYILHVKGKHLLTFLAEAGTSWCSSLTAHNIVDCDFARVFPHANFPLEFDSAMILSDVPVRMDPREDLSAIRGNAVVMLNWFRHKGPFAAAASLLFLLALADRRKMKYSVWIGLALLSLAPFVLYPLVHIEYRYVAPYLLVGSVAAWAWIIASIPERRWNLLMAPCFLLVAGILWDFSQSQNNRLFAYGTNPYNIFTQQLSAAGVGAGARLAYIGELLRPEHFYAWVRPGNLRLQSIIPDDGAFFGAPAEERALAEHELAERGIVALISPADLIPEQQRVGWSTTNLGYMFRLLPRQEPGGISGSKAAINR